MALRKSFFNKEEEKEKTDRTIQKVGGLRKPFFAETSDNTKEVETTTKEKSTIQNINPLVSAKKEPTDYLFKNLGETKQEIPTIKSANVSSDTYEGPSFKTAPEKTTTTDSSWKTIAKAVLPRNLEVYFGLTEPNAKERILQHEDTVQSYLREKRKEENVSEVTKTKEDYTPAEGFGEKVEETVSNVGYAGYVIDAFFKPAIGTLAEQFGLQNNLPQIREWGESFADKTIAEAKLTKAGQSIANVPGIFEGALLDPRFYASTVSQAVGFMGAILGTSILTTAVTRNPAAGFATGWAVGATLEDANAYQDMIDKGVSPDDANTAAQIYGALASLIENATGLRPAGGIKAFTEDFAKEAAKSSGVKKFFKTWAEEGILEEGSQQVIQNLVTMTVDKNQSLFEGVLESIIGGMIGAFPLVGATHLYNKMGAGNTKKDTVVKQTEGTTPPPDGGTPPTPPDGETTPVEPKFTAQEVVRARDILTNSKPNVDFDPKTAATLQKTIDTYQKDIETPVLEIINEENTSLANIKVIEYPDGRWGFSYEISTDSNGILSDYLSNKLSNTKEGAIQSAKDSILEYAKTEIDNVEAEAKSEFSEIIKQLEKVNVKEEVPIEIKKTPVETKEETEHKQLFHSEIKNLSKEELLKIAQYNGIYTRSSMSKRDILLQIALSPKDVLSPTPTPITRKEKPVKTKKEKDDDGWTSFGLDTIWSKNDNSPENGYVNIFALSEGGEDKGTFRVEVNRKMVKNTDGTDRLFNSLENAKKYVSENPILKTQKEKVTEAIKESPKTIKEISEETNILEPNVRRILGVGAKEGTFERVEKGVYVLSKDGQDIAWVETGNSVDSLPKLASEGFKADMVFLDIPYDTPAVKGGNRGVKYNLLSLEDFSKVLDAIVKIAKTKNTPVIHMYSQAESGLRAMAKYNDLFIEKGFKPVGKGQYQKTFANGDPVTSPNGKVSRPEGILVFTQSGELNKDLKDLNFTLKRPKGYQTEKPAEMLKAMIEMTTEEGDIVLDPFAGSGVTGAEAIRAGRKAYLIETDPEVAEKITKPRVKESLKERISPQKELDNYILSFKDTSDFMNSFDEIKFHGTEMKTTIRKEGFKAGQKGGVFVAPWLTALDVLYTGGKPSNMVAVIARKGAVKIPDDTYDVYKPEDLIPLPKQINSESQLEDYAELLFEKKELPNQRQEMLDSYREAILPEYNQNPEIVKLDAFIDKIRKLDPKNEDDAENIENGLNYEVVFSYPHSLGEMGNQTSIWSKTEPTIKEISEGIIETYQEEKMEINNPLVAGIVAKSGRDEDIEKAIDIVLENLKPEKKHVLPSTKKKAKAKTKAKTLSVIEVASKIISKKTNLPILTEFKVKNGKMFTTDLEIFVELNTDLPNGMYKLVGKDSIKTETDPSDFPLVPDDKGEVKVAKISTSILQEELKKSNLVKSKNQVKPELTSVFVDIKDGKINLWSTDSFRLYYKKGVGKGLVDAEFMLGATDKLEKVISSVGETVEIINGTDFVTFSGSNGKVTVRKIIGQIPDLKEVIPSYKKRITFNKEELISTLKELKPYLPHDKSISLSEVKDGKITITAENKSEEIKKELIIRAKQDSVSTPSKTTNNGTIVMPMRGGEQSTFDLTYLLDATNSIEGDTVYFFKSSDINLPTFMSEEKDIGNESEIETFKKKQEIEINSFINSTQILKELKDYFNDGEIKINFVKQILMKDGGEAWARHSKGIIDFVNNPLPSNTPSHEAVHAFLSLFISPEVKKQYTEEAVQRQEKIMGKEAVAKGIKKLSKQYNGKYSDKRIRQLYGEELLADNFYDHVLKRKTQSFLSKLFDEIIYFVKRLRNSRNASRLYDDILTKKRDFSYNVFTAQENYNRKEGAKSLNSQNIIGVDPIINLKRDVHITDIHGNKFVIPSEEALTPYLMNGNKTLLKDGEEYVVSKSQYQNVLSNSIKSEAKEFAPELKDTEETIKVGKNIGQRIILGEEGVYKSLPKNVRSIIEKYNYEEGDYESNNKMIAELEKVGYTADYDLNGEIISLNKIEEDPTKFEEYTLPNGENYREILIKAPVVSESEARQANADKIAKELYGKTHRELWESGEIDKWDNVTNLNKTEYGTPAFRGSHWDEPNVLFHLRMNDRTYNGKKVSFMEEFQSDWAREARTKGSELVTKLPEGYYIETNPSQYGSPQIVKNSYGDIIGAGNSFAEARDSALDYLNKGRVPSNPLLKNWQELSIKRALVEAVNNNSDYLSWTTGEQQAARYSLSKEINSIEWSKSGETKQVNIIPKGDSVINVDVDSTGKITKTYGKAPADWTGKNLSDAIGKGISDKILSESGGSLSGEGLNIGGEWAFNLYDKQIKNIVEDLTGSKVEVLDMGLEKNTKRIDWSITSQINYRAYSIEGDLTPEKLKVGLGIGKNSSAQGQYIVTDILGNGKFKAVPNSLTTMNRSELEALREGRYDDIGEIYKETFDISDTKSSGQQAIKITPEIRALIKGEAPALKQPSGEEVYMPKEQSEEEFSGENAEFKSKWSVKMPLEPETKKTINKTSIITWVEKTFKIPIKGKVTHKFKASGVYYPKKWLIRLAKWGELPVMVHEVAHHIDMRVLPEGWRKNYAFRTELANLDYDQKKRRTSEGFAEYLRYKMTTDEAPKLAPVFNKFFEEFLEKNPTLKKDLGDLRSQLDTWFQQGAENRTIQHIDWEGEHTRIFGIKAKIDKAIKVIQKNYNDEFYVPQKIVTKIEEVIKRKLRPSENPAMLMEMSKGKAGAIARTFVMSSAIDEAGNPIGKSLKDILKPISRKEIRQFIAYAVSLRAINLEGRRIESGFDIDDSKFIVEKYKDRGWYEIALELTEWSNHLLDWVIHAGGLEGMAAERMRELNPIYVPFKRAFLEEVDVMRGGGGYVDTGSGIKAIKGSGRAIFNPIESMIAQSATLIAKAQKIRIATAFAELADENDLGGYITRIPAPIVGTKFDASQISDYISQITGEEVMGLEGDMLTVFTQGTRYTGKENVVTIFKDGKLKFYEIHPDLYETFKGVDPLQLGPIMKILSVFSQLLRLGATGLKLSFNFVRNPFRDSLSYSAFAKSWKANPLDPFLGNYRTIFGKKESPTGRFKSMGGALSGQIGLDRAMTRNVYDEMLLENLGKIGKTLLIIKNPLGTLQDIVSFPEMGPRSSEMERSYKKYNSKEWKEANPDWTEEDSFIQAFLDAQDVTINFTKSGKTARKINQGAAFFNVAIRGPEKLYRAFRDRPVQTIVKSILYLTTLALWSWSQNKDKEWYKNLEPAYKYNNVFFEVGDSVFRFPVPFELGTIFMALPQAALEGTSEGYGALLDILKSQIPNPMPSMIGPAVDIMSNKNYLGIPIESKSMQYQYVTERYKDYTSTLAKNLSKISDKLGMQLSPIQIDYLIDGYTGGFLRQFKVTGAELYDLPVLSDLMLRDPNYPKRQLNNYFEEYSTLGQKVNSEIATYDEENRYEDIKNFYESYKSIQLDIIDAKAKDNTEKVNKLYGEITKTLKAYGYD